MEDTNYSDEVKYVKKKEDKDMRKIHCSTDFYFETVRRQTFYFFRHKDSVDLNELAMKGYIYDRFRDEVACFSCHTTISKQDNFKDLPSHRNDPNCIMSIFPLNGCVPNTEGKIIDDVDTIEWLNAILNDFKRRKVRLSSPNSERIIIFDKKNVKVGEEAKFLTYDERVSTFANWFSYLPEHARPQEEKFAKAGFVYTGISDIVICHACKGGLFNVHKMDDPLRDHAQFYPHCPFITKIIKMKPTEEVTVEFEQNYKPYLMFHPMVKNLMFERFHGDTFMAEFLEKYVNANGQFPTDIISFKKKLDIYVNSLNI